MVKWFLAGREGSRPEGVKMKNVTVTIQPLHEVVAAQPIRTTYIQEYIDRFGLDARVEVVRLVTGFGTYLQEIREVTA